MNRSLSRERLNWKREDHLTKPLCWASADSWTEITLTGNFILKFGKVQERPKGRNSEEKEMLTPISQRYSNKCTLSWNIDFVYQNVEFWGNEKQEDLDELGNESCRKGSADGFLTWVSTEQWRLLWKFLRWKWKHVQNLATVMIRTLPSTAQQCKLRFLFIFSAC